MITGIFFDLGGTLFDYEATNSGLGRELVSSLMRLSGAADHSPREVGKAYREANRVISSRFAQLDYYLHADLFRATYIHCADLIGAEFDEGIYEDYRRLQHESIVSGMALKADCRATLESLKEKGLYLSIGSNIDEDMLQPMVRRERLDVLLDDWTSSEAALACKPHPRFFEVTLAKSGLAPGEVLFVGDSPEHDVNGASAAGMRTVLIRNSRDAPLQTGAPTLDADFEIESLSELVPIADGLMS